MYLSGSFPFAVEHTQILVLEAEVLEELIFAALVDQEAGGARGGAEAESGGQEARHQGPGQSHDDEQFFYCAAKEN